MKRLDTIVKESIKRFLKLKIEPAQMKLLNKLKSMDDKNLMNLEELGKLSQELQQMKGEVHESKNISNILILNKMDLVTNKRKLRELQEELEDIGVFDKVFHISALTGN